MALLTGSLLAATAPAAPATPTAAPGDPQPPVVVFTEDFENGQTSAVTWVDDYTGPAPLAQTYRADPAWLTYCNGIIASPLNQASDPPGAGCFGWWPRVKDLARVLGDWSNGTGPTNHAVTAYTHSDPGAGRTQLETVTPIPLSATNRFVSFAVDVAEQNCYAANARYAFYLLDGPTAVPAFQRPITPCVDATTVVNATAVGTFHSDAPVLFSGTSVGLRLVNQQPSGNGNDSAFDNIRVLDVTPRLDLAYAPGTIEVGQTADLTFTVTNTSELSAKSGWSFRFAVPPGLTAVNPPSATTCADMVFGTTGAADFAATGTLPAGAASCTITVPVRASTVGTHTTCAADVTPLVGLDPPGCTTLVVVGPTLAFDAHAHGALLSTPLALIPPLAPADLTCTTAPGIDSDTLADFPIPLVGTTSVIADEASGTVGPDGLRTARATANTAGLNLLNGLITADELRAESIATSTATGAVTATGSSTLSNLRVAGRRIIPAPNLRITIPLVGTVITDEHIHRPNGITVNALHIRLLLGTDIIVGHTRASLSTPGIPC
ncbi:choice-of-anchor P family protein [Actinokineospora globicatena]|uniref:choice-of-anchor P family protein n=1 Tax=Actinokineospora globicatena TaxID=103729 RepID=UPI0020A5EB97|nr:choice-of-anchor P family protein [Actinokineospora globicatena]GLW79914.1 hypothetical protein Aglo01_43950 [Actinokineospora globicatena]GLW85676.1 hypothetical protein Aglo02_33160 [Actinokineospora globicatena]